MLTVDKMFEYDFGFDYSDGDSSAKQMEKRLSSIREELSREHHNKVLIEIHQKNQSFWYSLIKEDILTKV
ncbi:hypothetical protein GAP32_185 [Cronobacter phage vB_CsaM_GAP32]|uniref:Uncharacterized protein n=1 Tax=Cronobacter phage vB_CsaM_GAP32 TaxID=1141136 RepID=K4F9J7_9CAUD|nr:hypothetical protein GAP32_185 [Cronobacter phage vB_CsaM_GAP32]AFC21635.1 hypothetical protein GAP32_185 [Cronobacter phage vB_CsaM_GAP32]